jgi:ParB family chromosome partitioning protein
VPKPKSQDAEKRTSVFHYAPSNLEIKAGLNARNLSSEAYQLTIKELAEDIAANGVRTPIEIFRESGHVYISHGHTRHAALMLLIKEGRAPLTVPCIPEPSGRNDADRIVDQYRLNVGSPLAHAEIAYNIGRLRNLGWPDDKIAQRHSKSVSWVGQMITFGEAAPETQAAVAAGHIAASTVVEVVRKEGPAKAARTIDRAIARITREGGAKVTAKHLASGTEAEHEPSVKQLRRLLDILRVHISRGDITGRYAASFVKEAGIEE